MSLVITSNLNDILRGQPVNGRISIDSWTLGMDCKGGLFVLNLYSQGQNYPEIISAVAVTGLVATLTAACAYKVEVWYWPGESSILHIGRFQV
jgi:hypothetical protein